MVACFCFCLFVCCCCCCCFVCLFVVVVVLHRSGELQVSSWMSFTKTKTKPNINRRGKVGGRLLSASVWRVISSVLNVFY